MWLGRKVTHGEVGVHKQPLHLERVPNDHIRKLVHAAGCILWSVKGVLLIAQTLNCETWLFEGPWLVKMLLANITKGHNLLIESVGDLAPGVCNNIHNQKDAGQFSKSSWAKCCYNAKVSTGPVLYQVPVESIGVIMRQLGELLERTEALGYAVTGTGTWWQVRVQGNEYR